MRFARLTLAAMVAGACASAASAQSVVFTNSQNPSAANAPYTIPLLGSQPVVVDPSGNLKAQCELETGTTRCVGIPVAGTGGGNPTPAGAPAVTLTSTAQDSDAATAGTQVTLGTQFTISASSITNSPEACVRSVDIAANGWSGSVLPGMVDSSVSLSTVGNHTFKLRCFNGAGAGEGTLAIAGVQGTVVQPPPTSGEPAACANYRQQHNFQRITSSAIYNPSTGASPVRDVTTLRGFYGGGISSALYYMASSGGQYFSMAFTGDDLYADFPKTAYTPGGQQQAGKSMASFAYMTVSKCQGDFRLRSATTMSDPYMACTSDNTYGLTDNMISMMLGTTHQTNSTSASGKSCTIDRTATYYLNIVFADPRDGLTPGEISCLEGTTCGMKYGTN